MSLRCPQWSQPTTTSKIIISRTKTLVKSWKATSRKKRKEGETKADWLPEGGDWDAGYRQTFQEKGGKNWVSIRGREGDTEGRRKGGHRYLHLRDVLLR